MELAVNTNFNTAERHLLYTTLIRWSQRKASDVKTANRSSAPEQVSHTCQCDAELCIEGLCKCPCSGCRTERSNYKQFLLPVIAQNQIVDVTL